MEDDTLVIVRRPAQEAERSGTQRNVSCHMGPTAWKMYRIAPKFRGSKIL